MKHLLILITFERLNLCVLHHCYLVFFLPIYVYEIDGICFYWKLSEHNFSVQYKHNVPLTPCCEIQTGKFNEKEWEKKMEWHRGNDKRGRDVTEEKRNWFEWKKEIDEENGRLTETDEMAII